jgi:hypothetical protein
MRPALRSLRVPQLSLFHSPSPSPLWATFPHEIREQTVRLLARLLRGHQVCVAADRCREARDE